MTEKEVKDRIADILKAYTRKEHIAASFVVLENYAEELVRHGVTIRGESERGENGFGSTGR